MYLWLIIRYLENMAYSQLWSEKCKNKKTRKSFLSFDYRFRIRVKKSFRKCIQWKNAHEKFPKQPMEKQMIPKYTLGMRASLMNTPTSTN